MLRTILDKYARLLLPINKNNFLYTLTGFEFQQLAAEALVKKGFQTRFLEPDGLDIISEHQGKKVGVETKHRKYFSTSDIFDITNRFRTSKYEKYGQLIFVTSAIVSSHHRQLLTDLVPNLQVVDGEEITRLIEKDPRDFLTNQIFDSVKRRRRILLRLIALSFVIYITAICTATIAWTYTDRIEKPKSELLQQKMETVERALKNLEGLEKELLDIKKEMSDTEQKTKIIIDEYEKAKELEKITEEQKNAFKAIMQPTPWYMTTLGYFAAFLIGIGSSLMASIIRVKWKQWRELNRD